MDSLQNKSLSYTDFNKSFNIRVYMSGFQLVAVIIQEDKPIVFYIQKLTGIQKRYTVAEK